MASFPSGRGPRWALWFLLILLALLCLILIMPARSLIEVERDDVGWSLHTRSLADITRQGFFHTDAEFAIQKFEAGPRRAKAAYCPIDVGRGYGPISLHQHYNWNRPGDMTDTYEQRLKRCNALREQLLRIPGTLAAALINGSPEQVRQHLGDSLVREGNLAVKLPEVGQPLRDKLADLMGIPAERNVPIAPLDVALVVGNLDYVRRWMPEDGPNGYQRRALFHLDQAALVKRYADSGSGWLSRRRSGPGSHADGFKRTDYYVANNHCDSAYAAFLANKGITPDWKTLAQAFISRLGHETPGAFRYADLGYRLRKLRTQRGSDAPSQDCAALMQQYRDVELSPRQLSRLSDMVGAQVLTEYQQMLDQAREGHSFESRAAEWQFIEQLAFNQAEWPLPSLPGMFVSLLKGQPSGPKVCAALDALPWMQQHDKALKLFNELAASWKGKPAEGIKAYLENDRRCNPTLLMPPAHFQRQTRVRNAFLKQAGLPQCHLVTPDGDYVHAQHVECTDDP